MAAGLRFSCDDAELGTWMESWFRDLELDPPPGISVNVAVRDTIDLPDDTRDPFALPLLEIRSGQPYGDIRVRWLYEPALATLPPRALTADIVVSKAAAANRDGLAGTFLTETLALLLRRTGWHRMHAATARDPKGRDWLIAGNVGSGKSTTAALLATHGWGVGGDDLTFLTRSGPGVEAIAARARIALRSGGAALLGRSARTSGAGRASGPGSRLSGSFSSKGRKFSYYPEDIGGEWVQKTRPTIVVFPRVSSARTRLTPVPARDKLPELLRWSAVMAVEPDLADSHLGLLETLVRQADCWRLDLGPDLFGGNDLLMQLVP